MKALAVWNELQENEELMAQYASYLNVDLMIAEPDLTDEDAQLLWLNIKSVSDPQYKIMKKDSEQVGSMIKEALHQGLDGWTDDQKMVINAFLADIALGVSSS